MYKGHSLIVMSESARRKQRKAVDVFWSPTVAWRRGGLRVTRERDERFCLDIQNDEDAMKHTSFRFAHVTL
ncbi:hypothetical protein L596_015178 [Steinernema carpocapsae]|uniref:Uncharacterized protein n=1 Tax=Steinernema carpocapsae TaxID=34508 RepID=A0A4U5NE67_STECR|nr:hypothetical protein L596_015178 [Steinernema carpocapsae]